MKILYWIKITMNFQFYWKVFTVLRMIWYLYLVVHLYERKTSMNQDFIQALLTIAISPQRFCFFTVCLVNYLHEVLPWWAPKWKFLKFRSPDCWKCISNALSDTRSITCTLFVCSNSNFSWNLRVSWGVLCDWVS